jgi:hypothetical protein
MADGYMISAEEQRQLDAAQAAVNQSLADAKGGNFDMQNLPVMPAGVQVSGGQNQAGASESRVADPDGDIARRMTQENYAKIGSTGGISVGGPAQGKNISTAGLTTGNAHAQMTPQVGMTVPVNRGVPEGGSGGSFLTSPQEQRDRMVQQGSIGPTTSRGTTVKPTPMAQPQQRPAIAQRTPQMPQGGTARQSTGEQAPRQQTAQTGAEQDAEAHVGANVSKTGKETAQVGMTNSLAYQHQVKAMPQLVQKRQEQEKVLAAMDQADPKRKAVEQTIEDMKRGERRLQQQILAPEVGKYGNTAGGYAQELMDLRNQRDMAPAGSPQQQAIDDARIKASELHHMAQIEEVEKTVGKTNPAAVVGAIDQKIAYFSAAANDQQKDGAVRSRAAAMADQLSQHKAEWQVRADDKWATDFKVGLGDAQKRIEGDVGRIPAGSDITMHDAKAKAYDRVLEEYIKRDAPNAEQISANVRADKLDGMPVSNKDSAIAKAYDDNRASAAEARKEADAARAIESNFKETAPWAFPVIRQYLDGKIPTDSLHKATEESRKKIERIKGSDGIKTPLKVAEDDYIEAQDKYYKTQESVAKSVAELSLKTGISPDAITDAKINGAARLAIAKERENKALQRKMMAKAESEMVVGGKTLGEGAAMAMDISEKEMKDAGSITVRGLNGMGGSSKDMESVARLAAAAESMNSILDEYGATAMSPKAMQEMWNQTESKNPEAAAHLKSAKGVLNVIADQFDKNPDLAVKRTGLSRDQLQGMSKAAKLLRMVEKS